MSASFVPALILAFIAAQLAVAADRHALPVHANPGHVVIQVARCSIYHLWLEFWKCQWVDSFNFSSI